MTDDPDDDAPLGPRFARLLAGGDPEDDGTDNEHRPRDPLALLEAVRDAVEREMMVYDALPQDPTATPLEAVQRRFLVEIEAWRRRGFRPTPDPRVLDELGLSLSAQLRARARRTGRAPSDHPVTVPRRAAGAVQLPGRWCPPPSVPHTGS